MRLEPSDMRLVSLLKELQRALLLFLPCEDRKCYLRTRQQLSADTESAGILVIDFPASKTVRNTCLLF
jgi:hypothetical protein